MLSHPSAVWVPELFVCICWSSKPNSGGFNRNHRAVWAACFAHFLATPSNQIDRVHWVHAMPIALTLHFTYCGSVHHLRFSSRARCENTKNRDDPYWGMDLGGTRKPLVVCCAILSWHDKWYDASLTRFQCFGRRVILVAMTLTALGVMPSERVAANFTWGAKCQRGHNVLDHFASDLFRLHRSETVEQD